VDVTTAWQPVLEGELAERAWDANGASGPPTRRAESVRKCYASGCRHVSHYKGRAVMDLHGSLYEIAKLLLSEDDSQKTAEVLLRRVLGATGAERGFIVVREGDNYEQKFDVRFDRDRISAEERRFSRTLVRQAIQSQEPIYSPNLTADSRFSDMESVQWLEACSVLVAPLRYAGEVYGVVYLERSSLHSFPEEAQLFLTELAALAGLSLKKALEREALLRRSQSLERDLFARHNFEGIITRHPRMLQLLKLVAQVADSDATVLVRGETGTGKELVAQALHLNSSRRKRPFVTLHCTALPGSILESELFGHVRGAFTGAERDRPGRIASAAGGTLLLDEVAEIPLEVQVKLLRFLQSGEIQRLGSDRAERVDVRIVAATHQDLGALVKTGRFRQDLYFRLKVIELEIPPLRERQSDIPLLLEHFVCKHWRRGPPPGRWSARAEQALLAYGYPGNVRELGHLVERACLLATGPEMDLELLPPELGCSASAGLWQFQHYTNDELKSAREAAVTEVERQFLEGLMQRCEGNVSRAARESGVHRTYLQKLLAEHRA
jgi:transcriptional regulator with GAF, ATPase, and Fis domain